MSHAPAYPRQGLAVPSTGAGSRASLLRRALALLVDWLLCQSIAIGLLGMQWGESGPRSLLPLVVLVVEYALLVPTLGTTLGHRALGIKVVRVVGDSAGLRALDLPPTLPATLLRTALLCLGLPAILLDSDGRGLHDKAASTMVVRTR